MLIDYVENLEVEKVLKAVKQMLSQNVRPIEIQKQLFEGLTRVGIKYQNGECFIGDLIVSGMMMKEVLSLPEMKNSSNQLENKKRGRIVLGTVEGDIHDIGKDLISELLSSERFEVIDLGVDVSAMEFKRAVEAHKPDIVGISCILTTCIDSIYNVIESLKHEKSKLNFKIIIGGMAVSKKYLVIEGADAITNDAYEGLNTCLSWIKERELKSRSDI